MREKKPRPADPLAATLDAVNKAERMDDDAASIAADDAGATALAEKMDKALRDRPAQGD